MRQYRRAEGLPPDNPSFRYRDPESKREELHPVIAQGEREIEGLRNDGKN